MIPDQSMKKRFSSNYDDYLQLRAPLGAEWLLAAGRLARSLALELLELPEAEPEVQRVASKPELLEHLVFWKKSYFDQDHLTAPDHPLRGWCSERGKGHHSNQPWSPE
jgi:hypothetical protein